MQERVKCKDGTGTFLFTPMYLERPPYEMGLISRLAAESKREAIINRDYYGTVHKIQVVKNRRVRRQEAKKFLKSWKGMSAKADR